MVLLRGKYEIPGQLLTDLRARFLEEYNKEMHKYHPKDIEEVKQNDWFLARYLIQHELNLENALKMVKKSLQFRLEFGINDLTKEDLPEHKLNRGTVLIYNHDKKGLPLLVLRLKTHKKSKENYRVQQQIFLYYLEQAVRIRGWNAVTVLLDLTDAGYDNVDMDFTKFILTTFAEYYAWSMNAFIAYNMPWYMTAMWAIIKHWIPAKHSNRIIFTDQNTILQYVDKDQLPLSLGGTCTKPYDIENIQETEEN